MASSLNYEIRCSLNPLFEPIYHWSDLYWFLLFIIAVPFWVGTSI